jgi:hypothetical protein
MYSPHEFLKSESGAVTVDWVVLTAAIVGLGLASMAVVSAGVEDLSDDTATHLTDIDVSESPFDSLNAFDVSGYVPLSVHHGIIRRHRPVRGRHPVAHDQAVFGRPRRGTVSPSMTSPASSISASGSCSARWITRFSGRAPKTGS